MGTAKKLFSAVNKAILADMREQGRINADMKAVEESLEICRTSAKPETRISRMGVAIDRLAHMCKEYPYQPNASAWNKQGRELAESYPAFIVANLSELIKGNIEKIERLKTQTARHNKAEKLTEKLKPYLSLTACDTEWLASQIFLLKKAYPPEGTTPIQEAEIPTPWHPSSQGGTLASGVASKATHVQPAKPLSWLGKFGIWFCWAMLCAPGMHKGDAQNVGALVMSIALTVVTVKWINRRRERANASMRVDLLQ